MNFGDVIWMFFLISALQPVLKQRFLDAARQRLLAKIERQRNSRVILLVHRQESMSFLGFPVVRYIDVNDSEEVLRAIHLTDPSIPVDIVLHTWRIVTGRNPDRPRHPQTPRQGDRTY